jgi:predicted ATPase
MTLEPLAAGAVADIVRHVLDSGVAPTLVDLVTETTEGNPFFAEEICRALLQSGQIVQEGGVWQMQAAEAATIPRDLRQLLRQRIAQSGEATVSALEVAAIIGRTFTLDILRRVAVLDAVDLTAALDAALQTGFIEEAAGGYRFRHGLIRRALQQAQSKPRRQRLHALIAAAIEAAGATRQETLDRQVEALAYHYEHSDRPRRALPYLIQAGERAAELYAFEAAVDYYERALALMDKQASDDNKRRWYLLESLAWWEKTLANTPRAVAYFEEALSLPASAGWQAAPNERARLHAGAAMALLTVGDTGAAEPHLEAAQELIDEENFASEYADILYNVAQLHWHRNQFDAAFQAAQRSLRIAEELGDPTLVARAFEMLALACHSLGEWQRGLDFEEKRSAVGGPELDVSDAFDAHL